MNNNVLFLRNSVCTTNYITGKDHAVWVWSSEIIKLCAHLLLIETDSPDDDLSDLNNNIVIVSVIISVKCYRVRITVT